MHVSRLETAGVTSMSDLDPNRPVGARSRDGMNTGTIAAIIVAVLIVVGLLLWHPWNGNNSTATNSSGTTTGQGSSGGGAGKTGAR